jgi:hypothetical protein
MRYESAFLNLNGRQFMEMDLSVYRTSDRGRGYVEIRAA